MRKLTFFCAELSCTVPAEKCEFGDKNALCKAYVKSSAMSCPDGGSVSKANLYQNKYIIVQYFA